MTNPSPFAIARETAGNFSNAFTRVKDESAIENILSNAMQSGNPQEIQNSIGKILSQVSPERQESAINYLQNAYKNVQENQKQTARRNAAIRAGVDPDAFEALQLKQYEGIQNQNELDRINGLGNPQPSITPGQYPKVPAEGQGMSGEMQPPQQNADPYAKYSASQLAQLKGSRNKAIAQGAAQALKVINAKTPLANQPVPPEISRKISDIMASNPNANSDQLALKFDDAGIPRGYSNSYVENRRQEMMTAPQKQKFEQDIKEFEHKESAPFYNKISEDAKAAKEVKEAIQLQRDAIASGKTGATVQNLIHTYLKEKENPLANIFQGKNQAEFILGNKVLASGFKGIFGSKPTEREFFWYETVLPNLLKSAETNTGILDYFEKVADFQIKVLDTYDDIVRARGGYRPLNVDTEIRDRMKNEFDQLIQEGNQLTQSIIDKFVAEAKGDPVKAKELAKKAGYDFK